MRRLVPLVILALLAAGCAGKPSSPDANATAPSVGKASANVTAANATNDDGTKPQAAIDTGAAPHIHDYWKGRERVTLFDGDLQPDAENATFATIFQVLAAHEAVAGGMLWRFPDGQIVYEGTGAMELTATWSDPRVTGIGFIYTAGTSSEFHNGGSLPNGRATKLAVTPEMCDMPHSKTSRWQFGFGPDDQPGALLGPFHLKIDIVRMRDVALFPAHPDFWNGTHQLTVYDADHHGALQSYALRGVEVMTQGYFSEDFVNFSHLVPMETQTLRFTFTITAATSTPGQVTAFGLFYRGADRSVFSDPVRLPIKPLKGSLPQTLTWEVPVDMPATDSPYANASAWNFFLEPQVSITGADGPSGGLTNVEYSYHGTVTALDSKTAATTDSA